MSILIRTKESFASLVAVNGIAHCRLPKVGLGNQLFPLMTAAVFAWKNGIPLVVTNYHQIRIGILLRGERNRHYMGYFNWQKSVWTDLANKARIALYKRTVHTFKDVPSYHDYFEDLKPHRVLVKRLLHKMIRWEILCEADEKPAFDIGLHVRMGDYKKLPPGADFAKAGGTRTPHDYFIDVIRKLKSIYGSDLRIGIFSDGKEKELKELLAMPNTTLVKGNRDIVDMLLLSRSRIIIPSSGSTFSYWASFLSADDTVVIMHPDHIYGRIRNEGFEGPVEELLIQKSVI